MAVAWLALVAAAALLLLCITNSWQGCMFAFAALLLAALPRSVCRAYATKSKKLTWIAVSLIGGIIALLAVFVVDAVLSESSVSADHRVNEVFTADRSAWLRYSPTNLVPEADQLAFGFTLMPFVDPILNQATASRLKKVTAEVYRELERDSDFRTLRSAMPDVYAELVGFRPVSGQVFVYAPKTSKTRDARPVVVFFHGSGGNFKAYLWVMAALADRLDFVLVAPSGGMGDWRGAQSTVALESALVAAERLTTIDRRRIHVVGLSNGGRAVTQLGASSQEGIRTLTFISPVFDVQARESLDPRHPVLVVTGELDDRVPLDYVRENVQGFERRGVNVELRTIPQADHFLMFTHRHELSETLAAWLKNK